MKLNILQTKYENQLIIYINKQTNNKLKSYSNEIIKNFK